MRNSVLISILLCAAAAAAGLRFEEHTIADDLAGGYQVVPCDVNGDGKTDLIALASGMKELVWFENPGWQRHVLASNLPRMINLAAYDIDGDGVPEIALAYEFSNEAAKSAGVLVLLQQAGDPRQPWKTKEIDRLPTSHRLRWADVDGSGKKVLVDAPLTGEHATAPDYRDHVPLVYYKPGEWKRTLISNAEEGVMHGIFIERRGDRDHVLTASFAGIHDYSLDAQGHWQRAEVARGNPAPWPKSGSSDIAAGLLGTERFLAAIEPWHGNQLAVYRGDRIVIDETLLDGHTVAAADFDGDGRDEIVAGFRGKPYGVNLYSFDGSAWQRSSVDAGGMSAAACAAADLDGDGRIDLACIGSATHNLKWYRNVSSARQHR